MPIPEELQVVVAAAVAVAASMVASMPAAAAVGVVLAEQAVRVERTAGVEVRMVAEAEFEVTVGVAEEAESAGWAGKG